MCQVYMKWEQNLEVSRNDDKYLSIDEIKSWKWRLLN